MWSTLRIIMLGLWVGAMAGFAFLFAPTAFAHVGPTPQFAATIAASIRALTVAGTALGIVALAITLFARLDAPRTAAIVAACVLLAIALGLVETQFIVPKMEETPLLTPAYDALHRQSSGVYATALLAALLAWILSSGRGYRLR